MADVIEIDGVNKVKKDTEQIIKDIAGVKTDVGGKVDVSLTKLDMLTLGNIAHTSDIFQTAPFKRIEFNDMKATYTAKDVTDENDEKLVWKTLVDITGTILVSEFRLNLRSNYDSGYYNSFYKVTIDDDIYHGFCKSYHWSGSSSGTNDGSIQVFFDAASSFPIPKSSDIWNKNIRAIANNSGQKYQYAPYFYSNRPIKLNKLKVEVAIGGYTTDSESNCDFDVSYEII